jgi:hypothetical protein
MADEIEPIVARKLQPDISDSLEPLGSTDNIYSIGRSKSDNAFDNAEDFDELNQPAYEDIEAIDDSKYMNGLEYRVEEIHEKCTEIQRSIDSNRIHHAQHLQRIAETITFSLEPVHKMLGELATRMNIIEDKIDKLLAVGIAMQTGTEPIVPVKKPIPEPVTVVNQIVDPDLIADIMNGTFIRK